MKNETQLSQEEVQKLFAFVKSKYVRYVDLQYELVDHLASSIEDIQEADPKVSFEAALKKTYSRFPITGFTHFVENKQKALSRYWNKAVFRHVREYFKLPKIILLCILSFLIYSAFQVLPHPYVMILVYVLILTSFILNFRRVIINRKETEKYLFLQSYNSMSLGNMYCILFFPLQLFSNRVTNFMEITLSTPTTIIISFVLTLALIISNVTLNVIPDLLNEEVRTKYAHLNIQLA